jgi:hypothetical protein
MLRKSVKITNSVFTPTGKTTRNIVFSVNNATTKPMPILGKYPLPLLWDRYSDKWDGVECLGSLSVSAGGWIVWCGICPVNRQYMFRGQRALKVLRRARKKSHPKVVLDGDKIPWLIS